MKLTQLRSACANGRTCPNINRTDHHTLIIQGYRVTGPSTGLTAVEIPAGLLPEVTVPRPGITFTGRGTLIVYGVAVTDPAALAELAMPANETAVEISAAVLPEVMLAHAE